MKKALKWDEKEECYEECLIPNGASLFETDMNELVQCASCGKELDFGSCYTSRIYQTEHGFGYSECEECYFEKR